MAISANGDAVNYLQGAVPRTAEIVVEIQRKLSGTDRSGSITTGGTAQQLAASNANRAGLSGQNISTGDLWVNEVGGTAAVDTAGSYKVPAGAGFEVATSNAISIVGDTTGQKFTATET